MTTVVNNPAPVNDGRSRGGGFLVGVVVIVIFIAALLYFGIPVIKNIRPAQINVPATQINVESPEINTDSNNLDETAE